MNFLQSMVTGFTWKMKMCNDAVFCFWTPVELKRSEAKVELMKIANALDDETYFNDEIISIWKVVGKDKSKD